MFCDPYLVKVREFCLGLFAHVTRSVRFVWSPEPLICERARTEMQSLSLGA